MKPYSDSCVQNQEPIFTVLQPWLADKNHVLEIGSGTGQHAIYFAQRMPHLIWQTSDQAEYQNGIKLWLAEAGLDNTPTPIELNVGLNIWPKLDIDAIFSANVVHIMSWDNVINFIIQAGKLLNTGGLFILYGPFNYNNQYTSESNARFDEWLKHSDPKSGIRHFEAIEKLALLAHMTLSKDIEMPKNNRILCWEKN